MIPICFLWSRLRGRFSCTGLAWSRELQVAIGAIPAREVGCARVLLAFQSDLATTESRLRSTAHTADCRRCRRSGLQMNCSISTNGNRRLFL
jgi:hypothetical protein